MKKFKIPYGDTKLILSIPDENLKAVIEPRKPVASHMDEAEQIQAALESPIGTPRLKEIVKGKKNIVIVTSDHTRSVPSKITLPLILKEIRTGSPEAEVKIIIATGLHRATTQEEQRKMFGDAIVDHEKIYVHDAYDDHQMVEMGTLPSGAVFKVNRLVVDCDVLVTEGFIEPHFFAGFSGGRKSILPGVSSGETISTNHSYMALSSQYATAGVLQHNPVHEDMLEAAKKVNVQFILNVALDDNKKIIGAFAGDLEKAHAAGCDFIRSNALCQSETGDIVVTSNGGAPLDRDLYQGPKAVASAETCAGEDGVIIMVSSCVEGFGGKNFKNLIVAGTPEEIDRRLAAIPPKESIPEQWSAQVFSRVMMKHKIILVTTNIPDEDIKKANFIPAHDLGEAMKKAFEIKGKDARVVVIPDGVAVLFH